MAQWWERIIKIFRGGNQPSPIESPSSIESHISDTREHLVLRPPASTDIKPEQIIGWLEEREGAYGPVQKFILNPEQMPMIGGTVIKSLPTNDTPTSPSGFKNKTGRSL